MLCVTCSRLETAFQSAQKAYVEALSSAFNRVCTRHAAYFKVELERARIELEDHHVACNFVSTDLRPYP